ncbi:MAG: enolase-like domain-containing protein [Candidatus Geothermincolia bacterium]
MESSKESKGTRRSKRDPRDGRSYANGNPRFDRTVSFFMPRSWREGIFYGAWSTAEFVKWGYFAVALHVQVLVGIFYPSFAKSISGSLGGFFLEFGTSILIAAAFAYIMIGGHQSMHALEAAKTYNLERTVQETIGAKFVEKKPDGGVKFRTGSIGFWTELIKMFFVAPTGKFPTTIREGLNFRLNGTPSLNVSAAGPRFDLYMAYIFGIAGLALFGISIGLGRNSTPAVMAYLTPKILALGTIAFLGRHQDANALYRFREKKKIEAKLAAQAAAGTMAVDAGKDEIDARTKGNFNRLVGEVRNFAVYGGDDPRFKDVAVYLPEGAHNAIQGGKHTEYIDAEGNKGNTSPDLVAQEKWIIMFPKTGDDVPLADRGFFGTLKVLPKLQNQVVAEILSREGVSGGGRENEGGCSFNGYGGGDEAAISLLMEAAAKAGVELGYNYGENLFLGIDNAADSDDMFDAEAHLYTWQGQQMSGDELVDRYVELFYKWGHQLAFEDPFAAPRTQWQFWQKLNERIGDKVIIIGDDVVVTNPSIAYDALKEGVCNAGLVKLNQVGTFSQAWMYMEVFHSCGKNTVISHRSTQPDTIPDPLEVTATLAASYKPQGRVVLAKLGGVFLANRAGLYYYMQKGAEDWRTGASITPGVGDDVTITSVLAYPSTLGAGKYGLTSAMRLSNGIEIVSPIPGGLSRGENETKLMGPEEGIGIVNNVVEKLGLIGKPLGAIGNVFEIERMMMAMDIEEARRTGVLPDYSEAAWDKYEEEAGFKRMLGGDVTLTLGQLLIKAVALRDGLPPWLVYRQHGLALNEQIKMSFDNYPEARKLFYEPIFTGQVGEGAFRK